MCELISLYTFALCTINAGILYSFVYEVFTNIVFPDLLFRHE
jgi:hypothetical protein